MHHLRHQVSVDGVYREKKNVLRRDTLLSIECFTLNKKKLFKNLPLVQFYSILITT